MSNEHDLIVVRAGPCPSVFAFYPCARQQVAVLHRQPVLPPPPAVLAALRSATDHRPPLTDHLPLYAVPFPHLALFLTGIPFAAPGRNFHRAFSAPVSSLQLQASAFAAAYLLILQRSRLPAGSNVKRLLPFCRLRSSCAAARELRLRHDPAYLAAELCDFAVD